MIAVDSPVLVELLSNGPQADAVTYPSVKITPLSAMLSMRGVSQSLQPVKPKSS